MGDHFLDDIAVLNRREIVSRIPTNNIKLTCCVDLTDFERFKGGGFVAEELDPNDIEIVGPAPEGHVCAPVIFVSPQLDKATWLKV